MKKTKNILLWIALNALTGWLVYLVIFTPAKENHGLVNLTMFGLWAWGLLAFPIAIIAVIYSAIFKPTEVKKATKNIRSVPAWMSHTFDCLIIAALAYGGWIWTAIIWLGHMIAQSITVAAIENIADKQNAHK